jgi:hypothetical protein
MTQGVLIEAMAALKDVKNVSREYGTPISINYRDEADIVRDSLGMPKMKKAPSLLLATYALPVEYQPSEKKLEEAGIREKVDLIVKTPLIDWINAGIVTLTSVGISFSGIDIIRMTAILDGVEWKIADKGIPERVGEIPHHISLGLRRN